MTKYLYAAVAGACFFVVGAAFIGSPAELVRHPEWVALFAVEGAVISAACLRLSLPLP